MLIKLKTKVVAISIFLFTAMLSLQAQRQIETLTRGTLAVRTASTSVLVSWRFLATDPDDIAFNVYRSGVKINATPIASATNMVDNTSQNGVYVVKAIVNGVEEASSVEASVWANNYFDVPIQIPPSGVTPANEVYTYSANDASVGDLDGDGEYEIILKWDPSNAKDNSQSGYTGNVYIDAYKLNGTLLWRVDLGRNIRAGAHYTQFMVYDFDGDGKAELACKTAPGTKDGTNSFLKLGPAASDNDAADYRNSGGYVLDGPEYLTLFNGQTGAEMATVNYVPARGTVSSWGDNYGNRVDRFLAGVAYLDGERPSLIMCRGYYTRAVIAAWDYRNGQLTQRWVFDSNNSGYSGYAGQGNHSLAIADVDGDGKDEIVYGSCTIDHDGKGLYTTGLGHGDALHVTDHAPNRAGLEVFAPHEESGRGISFRDAKTGAIIWQKKAIGDIGRGLAGDITAAHFGSEMWAAGMGTYNVRGEQISTSTPSINHLVWWDGDLLRELLDGTTISKYGGGTLQSASGCASNNGTKANPALQADLFGDWREEVIWRTSDNTKLRIFTTPNSSPHRLRTLMHEPTYRLGIAWQNVAYNQPPHVGFYLGDKMNEPPMAPVVQSKLKWSGVSGNTWASGNNWKDNAGVDAAFQNGDDVLFSLSGNNVAEVIISGTVTPKQVSVVSPTNYTFAGDGSLTGDMGLIKSGSGTLTINGNHTFSGSTRLSEGVLIINGQLANSSIVAWGKSELGGNAIFGAGVKLLGGAVLNVGARNSAGITTINNGLQLSANTNLVVDLSDDATGVSKANDLLVVDGDLTIDGSVDLIVNKLNGALVSGNYQIATVTGALIGNVSNIVVKGVSDVKGTIGFSDGALWLNIEVPRAATSVVWTGSQSSSWDVMNTPNFNNQGNSDIFAPKDVAVFNNDGNSTVLVVGEIPIGGINVDASKNYTLVGTGSLTGSGGITKNGDGIFKLNNYNDFTGPVTINSGTLDVPYLTYAGVTSSIGAAGTSINNLVLNGGKLRYSGGKANTNRGMFIGANGGELEVAQGGITLALEGAISGGQLVKSGSGILLFDGVKSHSATVIRTGSVNLFNDAATPGASVVFEGGTLNCANTSSSWNTLSFAINVPLGKSGTINLDSRAYYTGALTGEGSLIVNIPASESNLNGNWSAYTGTINFVSSPGTAVGARFGNANGMPGATVNLGANVNASHLSGVSTKIGALTGTGSLTGNHNWEIGHKNTSFTFSGTIAAGSLTKVGTGRMTLTNANTYSGGTIIDKGSVLLLNSTGSATGIGGIIVRNSAALSGTGTASGSVTVQDGGNLLPGNLSSIGAINIGNHVTFQQGGILNVDVEANGYTNDVLNVLTASVTLQSAILQVSLRGGTYKAGDKFKIINCPVINGSFASVIPATPAEGLFWDLSEINSGGFLKITDVSTAVGEHLLQSRVKVYPNPVTNILTVDLPNGLNNAVIELTDVAGIVKHHIVVDDYQEQLSLNMSTYSKGVYLLRIRAGSEQVVIKITKK